VQRSGLDRCGVEREREAGGRRFGALIKASLVRHVEHGALLAGDGRRVQQAREQPAAAVNPQEVLSHDLGGHVVDLVSVA
jgi:hypothetical protein